ncbi:MAG: 3,4-dihydroxy-2-butanone-4-phosphate synthase [Rothia sp. (in: high G+C Gram-positive bacteria)]|nr:3,4-dihydroxy-2-butanone-4-phosphate synthase [Rothia sp. (in: high G+C Gram-positive bacteria)]
MSGPSGIVGEFRDVVEAISALTAGRPVIVTDDDQESAGHLIVAGELISAETMGFLVRYTSGYICAPLTAQRARELGLPLMVSDNQGPRGAAYTVSCDAVEGISTGISAADRARTVQVLADPQATADSIYRPGHVLPLIARDGGVLERNGRTEAAIDLCRIAGLEPVAAIGEVVHDDGSMMRMDDLQEFGRAHGLPLLTIERLVSYLGRASGRLSSDPIELPTEHGVFEAVAWNVGNAEHMSLSAPGSEPGQVPLVRLHSECLTGDVFASHRCDCGQQLAAALARIQQEGGTVVYLRNHEGRGIGLVNKMRAYRLQQMGADTVEANELLGLPGEARDWRDAATVLSGLGLRRIRLLTNNPIKVEAMRAAGIEVVGSEPLEIDARPQNVDYLRTKRDRMNHTLTRLPQE